MRIGCEICELRGILMNNIDVANGMIFQKLKISKDSLDDRLTCQKKCICYNR